MTINLSRPAEGLCDAEVNLRTANAITGPPGEAHLGREHYILSTTGPPFRKQHIETNMQIMQQS